MRIIRAADVSLCFPHPSWGLIIKLSYDYGWRPRGTLEPLHWQLNPWLRKLPTWNAANYFADMGQRVSPQDALGIGRALQAALPDVPVHDAAVSKRIWRLDLPGGIAWTNRPGTWMTPFEYFSGANRRLFTSFITVCSRGGFSVW